MNETIDTTIKNLTERIEQLERKQVREEVLTFGHLYTFEPPDMFTGAGDPYCSPGVLKDVWKWYGEARDLAREALAGPRDSDHHEDMMKRLKNLDSRCIL